MQVVATAFPLPYLHSSTSSMHNAYRMRAQSNQRGDINGLITYSTVWTGLGGGSALTYPFAGELLSPCHMALWETRAR